MKKQIDHSLEYLKEVLDYNPETGVFTWKHRPAHHFNKIIYQKRFNNNKSGKELTYEDTRGYLVVQLNYKYYKLHRLAWLFYYGYWPIDIDHINGIRNDNRICNLREANMSENSQNLKKAMVNNKSTGLLGVYWKGDGYKFESRIMVKGKSINVGCFDSAEIAHNAYIEAKRKYHSFNTL